MSKITITLNVSDFWGLEDLLDDLKSASESELGKAIIGILAENLELFPDDLEWRVELQDRLEIKNELTESGYLIHKINI